MAQGEGACAYTETNGVNTRFLWRGDLSPFGCEAVVKPAGTVPLSHRSVWLWGCFAAQRG